MRVRSGAALWVWPGAAAALLTGHAQHSWATPAPGTPLPGQRPLIVPGAGISATPKPKPPVRVRTRAPARAPAAAPLAGPPGTGMSNLACVVFEGRTGPDARSTLYNRCGTGVRLNYCLQYKNGADNCLPMTIGWEATLWDLSAGQSLVMPATDILKRWSVFACQAPLTPWQAVFRDGNLMGACVETGLEPPRGAPAPNPTIRSNDPSTWPAGTVNMTCLNVAPALTRHFQMQLVNRCARPVNVVICATTNVPVGSWPCVTPVPDHVGPPTEPGWAVITLLPRPSQIVRWSAFACEDPGVPRNLRYEGTRLVGDCVAPPEVNVAAALPRRSGNKATTRLSAETSAEEIEARARQRSATSAAIDSERSRISADANNMLGVLGDVALQTAQTYAAVEAQQQQVGAANALAQQQLMVATTPPAQQTATAPLGPGYSTATPRPGNSQTSSMVDAQNCLSLKDNGPNYRVDYQFIYKNICTFTIFVYFANKPGVENALSPGDTRGFDTRVTPLRVYRFRN